MLICKAFYKDDIHIYNCASSIFSVVRKEEVWNCWIDVLCLKSSFTCIRSSLFNDVEILDKVIIQLWSICLYWIFLPWGLCFCTCGRLSAYFSIISLCFVAYIKDIAFVKALYHPFQILLKGYSLKNATPLQHHRRVCMKHLLLTRWDF